MIGLVVSKPTVGMQRHSSGKLPVSAPPENASLPAPVMTAARCAGERSNSWNAFCSDSAVSAQIALRRSARLMVISVVPSELFSTRTFCMGTPFFNPHLGGVCADHTWQRRYGKCRCGSREAARCDDGAAQPAVCRFSSAGGCGRMTSQEPKKAQRQREG